VTLNTTNYEPLLLQHRYAEAELLTQIVTTPAVDILASGWRAEQPPFLNSMDRLLSLRKPGETEQAASLTQDLKSDGCCGEAHTQSHRGRTGSRRASADDDQDGR
jgi:hypothetical protein